MLDIEKVVKIGRFTFLKNIVVCHNEEINVISCKITHQTHQGNNEDSCQFTVYFDGSTLLRYLKTISSYLRMLIENIWSGNIHRWLQKLDTKD